MALKRVLVARPSQLPLVMRTLNQALQGAVRNAMIRTARFGHTAVVRTAAKTVPKPEATQTYRNAWTVTKTKKGAILGNSALSSYFVEVGRKPGRMPPFSDPKQGILHWVRVKKFKFKGGKIVERKKRKSKPKSAAKKKVAKVKKKAAGNGPKPAKKPSKAKLKQIDQQKRFAFLVARKIALKGTPGRYVLLRTMPSIKKRLGKEIKKGLKTVQPRGR